MCILTIKNEPIMISYIEEVVKPQKFNMPYDKERFRKKTIKEVP
jgi:hypothetical protein